MKPKLVGRLFFLRVLGVGWLFFLSCADGQNIMAPDQGSIYFNSFESPADTVGWRGHGSMNIANDAPQSGGKQSLRVSGGCVVPHAEFVLPAQPDAGYYVLQFWGKDLAIGGGVSLTIDGLEDFQSIGMQVTQPQWRRYESSQSLFCPPNRRLKIRLMAGGIVASAMLVDQIQIIKLNRQIIK
ncbi:MAG: hypothetical protein ACE5HS_18695 [bacterium]